MVDTRSLKKRNEKNGYKRGSVKFGIFEEMRKWSFVC